jgi:hypothetical protein
MNRRNPPNNSHREVNLSISRERFSMALNLLSGSDWKRFEDVATTFLCTDYPNIRTTASPSGDGGRDAEFFSCTSEPNSAIQISVAKDWKAKIKQTLERLSETSPNVTRLVYVTNQVIGAQADDLRKQARQASKALDILDQNWFLDRSNQDSNREAAAEELARRLVDPALNSGKEDKHLIAGLEDREARTALLFLEMQVHDSDRALGLTKSSFDALTLAALRDTSTDHRLDRQAIYDRVQRYLPQHPLAQIKMKVNASLERLKGIRHRKDNDEFHLTEAEITRVADSVARIDGLRRDFEADLANVLFESTNVEITDLSTFVTTARRVLETYFLRKGEDFAKAALSSSEPVIDEITLREVALNIATGDIGINGREPVEFLLSTLNILIATHSKPTAAYLALLLESYTLFAFLAATPDVQKSTRAMFGAGEIWLDTTVILPIMAEAAQPAELRPFTEMYAQVRKAGSKLYISRGMLIEIERHIHLCKTYVKSQRWSGTVPYLVSAYVHANGKVTTFNSWVERFVGEIDPIEDIAEYLRTEHNILLESADNHDRVETALGDAIRHAWQEVHTERRSTGDDNSLLLAAHDAEVYLHVLSSRIGQQGRSPFGYTTWWLTLDSKAKHIMTKVDKSLRPDFKIGPVLSVDYLIRYLSLGPSRDKVDLTGAALAKVYADALVDPVPSELMATMTELREKHSALPHTVIQRRIRDTLNSEKSKRGSLGMNSKEVIDAVY